MKRKRLPLAHFWFFTLFLSFFFRFSVSLAQAVSVPSERYQVDHNLKLILCNQKPPFPTGQSLPTIRFDKDYVFTQSVSSFETGKAYTVRNGGTDFTLFFTNFPLVKISTAGKQAISNTDARTKGSLTLANGSDPLFSTFIGIRIRGNASRLFPKKQYNVQLWEDSNGNKKRDAALVGLREDSKVLLLAMYNEPLRIQNRTAQALWLNMHKLYYQESEPEANSAIRTNYCDVFINDAYAGIYMLSEDMDRLQLKLKKTRDDGGIRGELYKTGVGNDATAFVALPAPPSNPDADVWAGFEMDYPDPYWTNLYNLLKFAITSPPNEFVAKLSQNFQVDNLIDYYIFLNLVFAYDHWDNNQFIARYKENEPYFLLPWDLDGVFGYSQTTLFISETRLLRSNGLFNRLLSLDPHGFKSKMRKRWFALRQNELSQAALKGRLATNFNLLTSEGAYTRESMKWPESVRTQDFPMVNSWLENRLAFLDEYFGFFPEEPAGIRLTYFQGEAQSGSKKVKWAFRSGTEATKVELEHSANGSSFSRVDTRTVTAETAFDYTHNNAASLAFYRLKIFTDNTNFTYTSPIQIGNNTCPNAPAAPSIRASVTDVTTGDPVILSATGCSHTVVWNTGQTGVVVVVNPAATTAYSAKCRQAVGCESAASATANVNVHAANALPGNFEGYLGNVACDFIRGWVWDRNKPNTPLYIDILDGQKVIGTTVAGIYRQDLKDSGKGDGNHSYVFATPEGLKNNLAHPISARIRGTNFVLRDSPKSLTCANITPLPTGNQPPVAPTITPLTATVNTVFQATLPAFTDSDSPALTYSLSGLPPTLTFTSATRTISGTPTATATLNLSYSASDGTLSNAVPVLLTISGSSTTVVTGNFEGYLDKVECESIRGWVWDRSKPNDALTVEFFANGNSIGTARADIFRQDLKDAGRGNGNHVYLFPTPASVKTGQTVQISAKVENSNYTLTWSPKTLNCPGGGLPTNQAPVAPTITPLTATVNTAFQATLPVFTDPDSPSLTYSLSGLPPTLTFTPATRTISGTPTTTATLNLTYSASDGTLSTSVPVALSISNSTAPVVTGNFEGYLDKVECGSIRGWVWDRDKPNTPFTVEFFANGQSIGTAPADIFRQDLKDAGKGNGLHVYNFTTPASVKTGQTVQISAKVQNSSYTLKQAPKPLNCAPNARLSVSAELDSETGLVLVTPNPTDGEFEVRFYSATSVPGELSVVDELGRSWYQKTLNGFVGQHQQKVRLSGASGSYVVLLRQGQQIRSAKVLIIR